MYPDTGKPELRASDAEREETAKRLHYAAVEGRLDADELDERLTAAYSARTCSELARLTADVTPPPAARPVSARPVFVRTSSSVNGLAVASVVFGVFWMGWFGSLLAIVLGHMSLHQIARTGQSGRGIAVAGLVLGYIGVLTLMLMLGTFSLRD